VLQKAGSNLTRENLLNIAAHLDNLHVRRGSNPGHVRSWVDAAGPGGATLIFSVVVRDGSMRWGSGDAAGEWP
jgi:hypothetical protein